MREHAAAAHARRAFESAFDRGPPEDWPPLPPPEPNPRLRRQISADDIVPLMTLIAGDSEGFEWSAIIERFLGILRTCSEGLDWRRSEPWRPLSRAAATQTYYGQTDSSSRFWRRGRRDCL